MVELIHATGNLVSLQLRDTLKQYWVKDGILYSKNWIKLLDNGLIKDHILEILNKIKLEGHTFKPKALSLVNCSPTWLPMTAYVNRYIGGCDQ